MDEHGSLFCVRLIRITNLVLANSHLNLSQFNTNQSLFNELGSNLYFKRAKSMEFLALIEKRNINIPQGKQRKKEYSKTYETGTRRNFRVRTGTCGSENRNFRFRFFKFKFCIVFSTNNSKYRKSADFHTMKEPN